MTSLRITFFALDLWSLCTWQSDVEALVDSQHSRTNMTMAYLTAPGMCYSALKALNYTTLLNTSFPVEQLMPGLDYFMADITSVLRNYFTDKSLSVVVSDYCAGNRTESTFYNSTTPVNGTWATLHVVVTVSSPSPQGLAVPTTTIQLRNLQRNCRGALITAGNEFFRLYQSPPLPSPPPPSPLPPSPSPPPTFTATPLTSPSITPPTFTATPLTFTSPSLTPPTFTATPLTSPSITPPTFAATPLTSPSITPPTFTAIPLTSPSITPPTFTATLTTTGMR
ncbi:hypothetical protein V8C86DRAFT_3093147 [Haematococcus lacustris]